MSTPPRLTADCYRGFGRFFLTICVERREKVFASAACVDRTRRELLRTAVDYRFAGIVYCFMPDHFHALFEAMAAGSDFRKCVNMLKQRTAFAHKRAARAKLWQHGYFDHVLRRSDARRRGVHPQQSSACGPLRRRQKIPVHGIDVLFGR